MRGTIIVSLPFKLQIRFLCYHRYSYLVILTLCLLMYSKEFISFLLNSETETIIVHRQTQLPHYSEIIHYIQVSPFSKIR